MNKPADTAASAAPPPAEAAAAVSFAEALRFWWKLGWISFGGPAGQIAIMHSELVTRRRWISEQRFLHALNYCMLLPGPEAQQLATYLGWLMHRSWGGIVAGALFVLPSLFILVALGAVYLLWGQQPLVAGLFYGIKPAVTAIVLHAAWRIGSRTLRNGWLWAIAAAAFVAIFAGGVPFPWIVAAAALAGWLGGRFVPAAFAPGGGAGGGHGGGGRAAAAAADAPPPLIDDDTPTPPHARFSRARLAAVCAAAALLWLGPMALLAAWGGAQGTLAQMAWFFTKAALLTFGGAYAVLPYVYQGAVLQHGWLTGTQMIDGLALGETTPGPLIMVVAFVGFVGGHGAADLLALPGGPPHPLLAGVLAATVVTWFTFLPSFVFILAGGPLVEATHDMPGFTAPLTAITAAVVGVVVNLAAFFGGHVLWPQGLGAGPLAGIDWAALAIALAAALALLRFKRGVMEVIAASALAGLLVTGLR